MSLEYRLWQVRVVLWLAIGLSLSVLLSFWSIAGAVVCFGGFGALFYWMWQHKKGPFARRPVATGEQQPVDPEQRDREAKYMVTQLLRSLTKVQVAYLCQTFAGPREGLSWLKRTLPRGLRPGAGELQEQLEAARAGQPRAGTRLSQQIVAQRDTLLQMIEVLTEAHKSHADHVVANPVVFVVTEHLNAESTADPTVQTLAGWNPEQQTLVSAVQTLNIFSEVNGERHIRGHASFKAVRRAIPDAVKRVRRDPDIFALSAVEDLGPLKLSKVPLGFVIGTAELM